jgi:hypothetical protein
MTQLCNMTFDDNTLTGSALSFDSAVTDGGDLSVAAAAKLAGTVYGVSVNVDDANDIYGVKSFSADKTRCRLRLYYKNSTLSATDGNDICLMNCSYSSGTGNFKLWLWYRSANSTWNIYATVRDDAGTYLNTSYYCAVSAGEHYIEIDWKASSAAGANNGFLSLYLDGTLKETISNVDNDTRLARELQFGALSILSADRGVYYLDEIVINDDGGVIGAYVPPGQPAILRTWGIPTSRRARAGGWN